MHAASRRNIHTMTPSPDTPQAKLHVSPALCNLLTIHAVQQRNPLNNPTVPARHKTSIPLSSRHCRQLLVAENTSLSSPQVQGSACLSAASNNYCQCRVGAASGLIPPPRINFNWVRHTCSLRSRQRQHDSSLTRRPSVPVARVGSSSCVNTRQLRVCYLTHMSCHRPCQHTHPSTAQHSTAAAQALALPHLQCRLLRQAACNVLVRLPC